MNPQRREWLSRTGPVLLGGLAVSTLGLTGCDKLGLNPMQPRALTFNAVDITGADYAKALNLSDPTGRKRSLEEFKGKVLVVFFGFTQCPDICPTTMAEVAELRRRLGAEGAKVQGIFVTIDPERDTPEVLTEYVKNLDPDFVALRGSVDEITQAAKEFKVFFQKVPTQDGKGYTMDHTAGAFVFDPQGRVRLFVRYGLGLDLLLADVKLLLNDPQG